MDKRYHYCRVRFEAIPKRYVYLAAPEIRAGDWVLAPFGPENTVQLGFVTDSGNFTAENAPWPVEQTKTILCKTDAPKR
jgi:predicted Mrr-cat superfamily restriction endonuclease